MKRVLWLVVVIVVAAGALKIPLVGVTPVLGAAPSGDPALLQMPGLTAVAVVGPIDGDTGAWTLRELDNMELAASLLEGQGVTVHRFYTPDNDWDEIVAAAAGAHFFLYRGHGPAWNARPDVGGLMLKARMVTPDELATDLDLAPGAIVMLYACYSAGSSGDETLDIGMPEARRRVLQYSAPFMELGVAGYYANWYGDAFEQFLRNLFAGQTLGDAYESYFDFNPQTVSRYAYPSYDGAVAWLDKDNWRGYWQYHNAFVGRPEATLPQLFAGAQLGGIPERLRFTYSLPEERHLVSSYTVTPQNVESSLALPWSLDVDGAWVKVTTMAGMTATESFTVWPDIGAVPGAGTYTGTVTVSCAATGQSEEVELVLDVLAHSFYRTFVPMALSQGITAH